MVLTGSNSEPMSRPGFSDGTMEESDGSVSEPCFVFGVAMRAPVIRFRNFQSAEKTDCYGRLFHD